MQDDQKDVLNRTVNKNYELYDLDWGFQIGVRKLILNKTIKFFKKIRNDKSK